MSVAFSIDEPRPPRPLPWGTLASVGLHAALIAALILVSPLRHFIVPPPAPVAVEIVTPAEFAALEQPPAPVTTAPLVTAPTGQTAVSGGTTTPTTPKTATKPSDGTITATQFYAAQMLKEPGMARIVKTLGTLADSERVTQLCNIEGLEQIRRAAPATDPDTLVPYAMADMDGTGLTLIASGGAFRSRRRWFGVAFRCTVASDYSGVTAFQFKLGEEIPPSEWDAHNLTSAEDEED